MERTPPTDYELDLMNKLNHSHRLLQATVALLSQSSGFASSAILSVVPPAQMADNVRDHHRVSQESFFARLSISLIQNSMAHSGLAAFQMLEATNLRIKAERSAGEEAMEYAEQALASARSAFSLASEGHSFVSSAMRLLLIPAIVYDDDFVFGADPPTY